ncbi:hypothetical protein ABL849_12040 [Variovorax sp. 375MFSha3.1]|jgi:hypothetical protein|uniref:hypothetical protein n=1 Tax=unclassified Variovorax TaxID=663243 RepID=UPI003AAAAE3A
MNLRSKTMDRWVPISRDELEELVSAQLTECSPEQADQFARLRVPFRAAPIMRAGVSESVFIVAQLGEMAIYYEDVEDGFNVSEVAPDGSIATPGFEQWTIADAIQHLLAFPCDPIRRGAASSLL